jgi:hypothetical protein
MAEITVGTLWHKVPKGVTPIYIGRAGKGKDGKYGNPYAVSIYGRVICLGKYDHYLETRPDLVVPLVERVQAGERLFFQCFCCKEPRVIKEGDKVGNPICHGEVLAKAILKELKEEFVC